MRKRSALLLLSTLLITACGGRSPADLQRTLGYIQPMDAQGQPVLDLATQNRVSMQTNTPFNYIYTAPTPETMEDTMEEARGESAAEASDEAEADLPLAPNFKLENLSGVQESVQFPRTRFMIITVANAQGSDDLNNWVTPLKDRYPYTVDFYSVIELSSVAAQDRSNARSIVAQTQVVDTPVLLDWTGRVSEAFEAEANVVNVYAINPQGRIIAEGHGMADLEKLKAFAETVDSAVAQ